MKVLVVGGGGREHAVIWSLSRSPLVGEVFCAPGNPGVAALAQCEQVKAEDVPGLLELSARIKPDLVVVGPEAPLVAGLSDALTERGTKVFGPGAASARLEGSKSFAKQLMIENNIPTAKARTFHDPAQAIEYVRKQARPVAVKADGLAAGKGVTVCEDAAAAEAAIKEAMVARRFGEAGGRIVIEERLYGPELSLLAFCEGRTILPMAPAQDFKPALDGNLGPNTGGMGSYSPVPICTGEVYDSAVDKVLEPVAGALAELGHNYVGVIYAGLMLTQDGLKVIEFNCRFGDPETQALIPRLESDLAETMLAAVNGELAGAKLRWSEQCCVSVVAASAGYPSGPSMITGIPIQGLKAAERLPDVTVFHSGTKMGHDGVVTAGGRVLSVSALGPDQEAAREKAYAALGLITFDGMHFRSDIAAHVAPR